jgi:hypothetical protein
MAKVHRVLRRMDFASAEAAQAFLKRVDVDALEAPVPAVEPSQQRSFGRPPGYRRHGSANSQPDALPAGAPSQTASLASAQAALPL